MPRAFDAIKNLFATLHIVSQCDAPFHKKTRAFVWDENGYWHLQVNSIKCVSYTLIPPHTPLFGRISPIFTHSRMHLYAASTAFTVVALDFRFMFAYMYVRPVKAHNGYTLKYSNKLKKLNHSMWNLQKSACKSVFAWISSKMNLYKSVLWWLTAI